MPRPNPPPTPGSSSDIRGKEGSISTAAPAFSLPPTAFQEQDRRSNSSSAPSANASDSSYRPVSPPSPADLTRKRPGTQVASGPVITKDDFALPPPPTRSRKIIQMKPRDTEQQERLPPSATVSPQIAGRTQSTSSQGGKRKQNNAGTAAGRKVARKTAHSLIERRRRSKMNEEFGILKEMIPATKGQEMHKLAILQASIDYLRYLEQCVADLQVQNNNSPRSQPPPAAVAQSTQDTAQDEDDDDDEEMEDDNDQETSASTPATTALEKSTSMVSLPSLSQITSTSTTSPSICNTGAGRHYSISSASQASYSPYIHSNQTSPAFGPQLSQIQTMPTFGNSLGLGSPALKPVDSAYTLRQIAEGAAELSDRPQQQRSGGGNGNGSRSDHELDHEAAAALSMLNHDRRSWRAAGPVNAGRKSAGMSVRDLLSG